MSPTEKQAEKVLEAYSLESNVKGLSAALKIASQYTEPEENKGWWPGESDYDSGYRSGYGSGWNSAMCHVGRVAERIDEMSERSAAESERLQDIRVRVMPQLENLANQLWDNDSAPMSRKARQLDRILDELSSLLSP